MGPDMDDLMTGLILFVVCLLVGASIGEMTRPEPPEYCHIGDGVYDICPEPDAAKTE